MATKYCRDCKFKKRAPYQAGPQQAGMIDICINGDFGDPVTGEPMPCMQVRSLKEMCGLDGKGFIKAVEEPKESPKLIIES